MSILSRRKVLALGAAGASLALLPPWALAQDRLDLVATTGMIADAVRQVGGDAVAVRGLMGSGVDPHTYRQTRSDIVAMTRADAVFWHGLYLEAQLEEFLGQLAANTKVFPLAESVPVELRLAHDTYKDRFDPHVWMAPELWTHVVGAARDALSSLVPAQAGMFTANAETHLAQIIALNDYARAVLATVPAEHRVLVTAHDAFKYFGRAFDFEVVGIQGISTESEAGLRRIEDIVAMLVERQIRAIFVESSVSARNVEALIEGAAARGHAVVIGGSLYSDAMGAPDSYEGTYIGMIDHNVTLVTRALSGQAPQTGLNGKLSGVA